MNRKKYLYAAAGVLSLLIVGSIYAWSVISRPIVREYPQWSASQISTTVTLVMAFFCLGCLISGLLVSRIRPQILVGAAALVYALGMVLASRMNSLPQLYLSFGVICGLASGFAYNAVIGSVSKWFPERQGLISGVLLMGFGTSSFLTGNLFQLFTPAQTGAWRTSFLVLGIGGGLLVLLCAPWIVRPPAPAGVSGSMETGAKQYTPKQTLSSPAFWLYYLWAVILSAAGLVIVSQASPIASEICSGTPAGTIAFVVGMISICNGIGRIIVGGMFDKYGATKTMVNVAVSFLASAVLLILAKVTGNFALLVAAFLMTGFSYGGVTPTNAAFISSVFGQKHYAVNFSLINTNLLFASFGSLIAGSLYDSTGSYLSSFFLLIGFSLAGLLLTWLIKKALK